ncbi:MAG TPA: hypothetical protein VK425_11820, partial [Acidimicrobiales bacterium]|nr:hypothetical protein [Acidimicrobiales bacterium]
MSFDGGNVLVRDEITGAYRLLEDLGSVGEWVLMSVFLLGGRMMAVFEEIGVVQGRICFVTEDGPVLALSKSLEPTQQSGPQWYRGHKKEDVLPGRPDILRYELLAGGQDPEPEEVRACFPPVRRTFWEGVERPHTFVGTPMSADVIPVYYRDVPMVSRVPTEVVAPETARAIAAEEVWEGLVGGWLPVARMVYPVGPEECWEAMTFAPVEGATTFSQPAWYRFVKLRAGTVQEIKYIDSFIPYTGGAPNPADFYRSLLALHDYWSDQLQGAMRAHVPDHWLEDFCRHAIVMEKITRRGDHPKYGVV